MKSRLISMTILIAIIAATATAAFAAMIEEPGAISVIASSGEGRLLAIKTSSGETLIAHLKGAHYEMGKQYGEMLGKQIEKITAFTDLSMVMGGDFSKDDLNKLVAGVWAVMRPHTPDWFIDEIRGIADGAHAAGAEVSELDLITPIVITNISDMENKNALTGKKASMRLYLDELAYTCSAFAAWGERAEDGKLFSSRILDWKPGTGTDRFRLITVYEPLDANGNKRNAYMTAGYIGLTGATNGMNINGITLSEIGSENVVEKLDGMPWIIMFRKILEESDSLDDAIKIIQESENTIGYNFVIGDGDAENYGTAAWRPRAAAVEENGKFTAVIYDDDSTDSDAVWIDSAGNKILIDGEPVHYGTPLKQAVLRADVSMNPDIYKTQTSNRGPGNANGGINPLEGGSYLDRHRSQYDALTALATGGAFNNPYTGKPVFEAADGKRLIGAKTALEIASAVAMPDQNVLAIVYAATDLDFYAAWENTSGPEWQPAFTTPYLKLNLKEIIAQK